MTNHIRPRAKKIAWMLTLIYFGSYLMRINFAVMIVKVCSDMSVEKTALSVVLMGLTIAYGSGQLVSGFLGDKIKPEYLITGGTALAVACNFAMFFSTSIPVMAVIWTINGFSHSMLWPPLVKLLSAHLSDEEYAYANLRVAWGSSGATILLYLACPLLLSFMTWRAIIFSCAVVGVGILVTWLVSFPKLFSDPVNSSVTVLKLDKQEKKKMPPLPVFTFLPIAFIMIGIVFQGALREGVTNWMPSYMYDTFGLSEENAILSTVVLAIFSMVSFSIFTYINKKFFKNELSCATVIFIMSAIFATFLYFVNAFLSSVALSMLLMSLIVACMHGINLMLLAYVPKRFLKYGKVSTFSGILNCCAYLGASIADFAFPAIAENYGWNATVFSWAVFCAAGLAVCAIAAPIWKKFCKHKPAEATTEEQE